MLILQESVLDKQNFERLKEHKNKCDVPFSIQHLHTPIYVLITNQIKINLRREIHPFALYHKTIYLYDIYKVKNLSRM